MFFAEVPRNDETQRVTVPIRQLGAVHLISKQGGWLQCLIEWNCVGVIIDTVKAHARSAGQRNRPVQNVPQRKTFPDSIADQSRIQTIANAHQRRFLVLHFESHQVVEPPCGCVLHKSPYLKMPKVDIHPRIDHVLRHAIKRFVRRDRLDDSPFVLRAVVAECCGTIKSASQRNAASSYCDANCAQHKCASANHWTEFVITFSGSSLREKSKANYERSFEHKNAEREQSKDGSGNCANEELASYRRSNAELLKMIVTAHLAHQGKERTRRDENREAIANDHERCGHAKHGEQQHRRRHHDSGEQPGK